MKSKPNWKVAIRIAIYSALMSIFVPFHIHDFRGDEAHYMMTAVSLRKDFDLNENNNYANADYRDFGFGGTLSPQVPAKGGFIPPEHGFGFPLLLLPFYSVGGIVAVRVYCFLCALACVVLVDLLVTRISGSNYLGIAAALVLSLSPSWQLHSISIYPEIQAALLMLVCALILLKIQATNTCRNIQAFALGAIAAFFPILYLKYTPISALTVVLSLFVPALRRKWIFYVVFAMVAAFGAIIWVRTYGTSIAIGSGGSGNDFSLAGSGIRYFRPWLDRVHGLGLFQPYILLLPLAIAVLIAAIGKDRWLNLYPTAAAFAYSLMYGAFLPHPGQSLPGRFLCAVLPFIVTTVVLAIGFYFRSKSSRNIVIGAVLIAQLVLSCVIRSCSTDDIKIPNWYSRFFFPFWEKLPAPDWHDSIINFLPYLVGVILVSAFLFCYKSVRITHSFESGVDRVSEAHKPDDRTV
jgi:hypothetical protein